MVEIIVYSSNMCGACEMVKEFLRLRGREFVERNVSVDLQEYRTGSMNEAVPGDRKIVQLESESK